MEANINEDNVQTVQELKEECRLMELEQDVHIDEDALIGQHKALREEVAKKDAKIVDMEQEIHALEIALRDHSHMAELEELVGVVHQKDERIEELEEALRESVRITAEREMVLQQEESRRKQIMEKVSDYEKQGLSTDQDYIWHVYMNHYKFDSSVFSPSALHGFRVICFSIYQRNIYLFHYTFTLNSV